FFALLTAVTSILIAAIYNIIGKRNSKLWELKSVNFLYASFVIFN
ncbi:MAG: hypothetical protein ACJA1B_002675, partial [Polaribacter sp.]